MSRCIFAFIRVATLAFVYAVVGCAPPLPSDTEAISNRPQSWEKFVAIIKLTGDPLLSSATVDDNGRRVIDPAHKKELLAEQERVVAELKELSPELAVIFRYRLVLNGLAIIAPLELKERIQDMDGVSQVGSESFFRPPQLVSGVNNAEPEDITETNSVAFIGSKKVHSSLKATNSDGVPIPVKGEGIRVAIVDTGIDYLHKMLGGQGNVEEYENNDFTMIEEGSFPTRKVIAGIDLVGDDYDTDSADFSKHIPRGDPDPLDEHGHGTHVAGTVAGIGDDINTYSGVAPDALLIAIRVFGAGETGESVIIKAIEYAVDPNGDYNLNDQAHVINMSLGVSFGSPYTLYQEAVNTAVRGGTVVVASAGNSGPEDYVVSNPSTADEAISVGASIDDSEHNWKFPALKLTTVGKSDILTEAVESPMAKPISEVGELSAPLYYIGLADKDLTDKQKTQLKGKAALIDRGLVYFMDKIDRAVAAGAVAVVMVNNVDTRPVPMGGYKDYQIPAVMITKKIGAGIKEDLQAGEVVRVTFDSSIIIERREVIDTLTSFSSYGPRSFDSLIKPEIVAPGLSVTSAVAGKGDKGVKYSGTSMSAPHISGVVALMRQYRPNLDATLVKSMLISNAKVLVTTAGERYAVNQQGAGRVDAYAATTNEVIFHPATLSLGRTLVSKQKKITGSFGIQNISKQDLDLAVRASVVSGLTFSLPARVSLKSGTKTHVDFAFVVDAKKLSDFYQNLDGHIELLDGDKIVARLPLLLGVKKLARVSPVSAVVQATSEEDSYQATIEVELKNPSTNTGKALLFNLLGLDTRQGSVRNNPSRGENICDLQSAGYRISEQNGDEPALIQFAAKLYYPLTTWHACRLSVQIDGDNDGIADQELIAGPVWSFITRIISEGMHLSILTNAHKMRELRLEYERNPVPWSGENYVSAIVSYQPLTPYNHATLIVATAKLEDVVKDAEGDFRVKLAVLRHDRGVSDSDMDDFLADHADNWQTITPTIDGSGFWQIPDHIAVPKHGRVNLSLIKGGDPEARLVAYFPHNASTFSHLRTDHQSRIIPLSYLQP